MKKDLLLLVKDMVSIRLREVDVISWSSPIPSFGNLATAKIATVGLNPSNREFVDESGRELEGADRRFHTLRSLGLKKWKEVQGDHLELIIDYCFNYFSRNPYDSWFKKLDHIISGSSLSYYFPSGAACHLDLIPYATFTKWTDLLPSQRKKLLEFSSDYLGMLINHSQIEILVLNGQTVVHNIEQVSGCQLKKTHRRDWSLPRKSVDAVQGFSYQGKIDRIGRVTLNKPLEVLGYNHNIQSSFGVTKNVQKSIRNWVTESITNAYETSGHPIS